MGLTLHSIYCILLQACTTVPRSCDHNDDSSDSDVALSADALQYEDIQPVVGCRCAAVVAAAAAAAHASIVPAASSDDSYKLSV